MSYDQPVPFLILDDFLDRETLSALLDYTLAHQGRFSRSGVIDGKTLTSVVDPEYRRSLCLDDLGPHHEMFTTRIASMAPRIADELRRGTVSANYIEATVVASNDGEFFKRHADNACDGTRIREITFVYYFHREPKGFSGGQLRIYTSFVRAIMTRSPIRTETIAPLQNRIVFFPSCMMHEVLPVCCPSHAFADSRFSITGWIHK